MYDPNHPYVPKPYPKLVYRDHGTYIQVENEDEQAEAEAEGYVLYGDLPPLADDGLEMQTTDRLRERLTDIARRAAAKLSREDMIVAIREAVAKEAEDVAKNAVPMPTAEELDAMLTASINAPSMAALDRDGDGKLGGSLSEDEDPEALEKAKLRADLTALGVRFHHKNGVETLSKLLEEATAPKTGE